MTKKDLIEELAFELGLPKKDARRAVDLIFENIASALISGDSVKIKDFASFHVVEKAERNYRNNMTGELMTTAPGKRVKVSISQNLLERIE